MTSQLTGEWIGRPDTTSAAAARNEVLQASQQTGTADAGDAVVGDPVTDGGVQTDLEQHDVTIHMALAADKSATLSLGDGSQPRQGVWRVITTLPPNGAEIEISLNRPEGDPAMGTSAPNEKRRFIIDFQESGQSPGFTLVEKGADPQFGRLYFVCE